MEYIFGAEHPDFKRETPAQTEYERHKYLFEELVNALPPEEADRYELSADTDEQGDGYILVEREEESFLINFHEKYVTADSVTKKWDYHYFFTYDEACRFVNYFKMFLVSERNRGFLFGGTFNPMTKAHLGVCEKVAEKEDAFVTIVPTSDQYLVNYKKLDADNRINERIRYSVLTAATWDKPNIIVEDMEVFFRVQYTSTFRTLYCLKDKYRAESFRFVMGSDDVKTLSCWLMPERILEDFGLCVVKRMESEEELKKDIEASELLTRNVSQIEFVETDPDLGNYSATKLRNFLREGQREQAEEYMGSAAFAAIDSMAADSSDPILVAFRKGKDNE